VVFPIQRFRWHAAQAVMAANLREMEPAVSHARNALEAADAERSGFAFHQNLGLVRDQFSEVRNRLRAIAG
jgi:hypothetical protein